MSTNLAESMFGIDENIVDQKQELHGVGHPY